jgi:hypothetical protein
MALRTAHTVIVLLTAVHCGGQRVQSGMGVGHIFELPALGQAPGCMCQMRLCVDGWTGGGPRERSIGMVCMNTSAITI